MALRRCLDCGKLFEATTEWICYECFKLDCIENGEWDFENDCYLEEEDR